MPAKKKVLLLGGLLMDRYLQITNYPHRGGDTLIHKEFLQPGGCPFHVAKTLQSLGAEPVIYSALSDDNLAQDLNRVMETEGLSREAVYPLPGETTGYCIILLDGEGERTFLTFRGCEGHFDPARITPALREEIAAVFVTGIYLLYPQWSQAAVAFLEEMSAQGTPVLFDPGSLIGEMDPDLLRRTMEAAAILTPNGWERQELERILGIPNLHHWAISRGMVCLAETRGAQGALLSTPEGTREIPPCPASPVDTTGTGDSFAGGLLAALLRGLEPVEAAGIASACGALTAETVGARGNFTWEDAKRRLKLAGWIEKEPSEIR